MSVITAAVGSGVSIVTEALEYSLAQRPEVKVVGADVTVDGLMDTVRSRQPDVVVVCADTPAWDGIGACAAVKETRQRSRVVVIGPEGDHGTLLAAVKAGADGFVTSAESVDDLIDALHQVNRGQSRIPSSMLGVLLRGLIEFRREDDAVIDRFASLGKREREVLVELVSGASDQAIATTLHLSRHTARTHVQNILSKLEVHSRLEAARLVIEHDLFTRFGIEVDESLDEKGRRSV